ncbi:MAG TPA: transposase [Candidatus Saccharimonadales bacterium]|nr:transposase [Candidatus Saccharimonadales bacterium]
MFKDKRKDVERQEKSKVLEQQLVKLLWPVLVSLKRKMDRRLVSTFLGLVMAIIMHRHRNHGLLLSELGGYLLGAEYGRAGTKRISNLVHSEKWQAGLLEDFLWQAGTQRVEELWEQGELPLVIWDESVLEKPESLQAEGLCAVRSSKAVRLKRIKPGFFNPPGGRPIFVPGFHWLQVLVIGCKGTPTLAHMHWWTTRGEQKSLKRTEESAVLAYIDGLWGKEVLHIWDRGFAGTPWLTQAFLQGARFVLRWPKNYQLLDEHEQLCKPGEISKGKRSWEHRLLWDARRRCARKTGIIAFPVFDPTHHQSLWLVIARRKGQSPWYLLTSEPAYSPELVWRIVLAYARRWQVEMTIRYHKCKLAFESPRLFRWPSRQKLLLIAALAYAFLLSLLSTSLSEFRSWLLHTFCPRTGKRSRDTPAPLYRLRLALGFLWLFHPPPFLAHL